MKSRVVTTPAFWEALERALPATQEPNWHQFAAYELGDILKAVALAWGHMANLYSELPEYRFLPGAGSLGAWSVVGQWSEEHGEVQLIDIVVDVWPPDMFAPSVDS
ncbi:hypothetical protein [Kineosporia succinea]|uniref:DUF4240 domain-containing protein n=1 Tax=Kineosporia succinea TaxID=84632 RepID=A0ABT9P9P2_9ACTN|nr:hypothetical protein [Kineosporia succinea]MDP9829414.1 hypothetical protein [Kineosporia succinea]